jgi:hypothetical protein
MLVLSMQAQGSLERDDEVILEDELSFIAILLLLVVTCNVIAAVSGI